MTFGILRYNIDKEIIIQKRLYDDIDFFLRLSKLHAKI